MILRYWSALIDWTSCSGVIYLCLYFVSRMLVFDKGKRKKRKKTFLSTEDVLFIYNNGCFSLWSSVVHSFHWRWLLDEPWIFSVEIKLFKVILTVVDRELKPSLSTQLVYWLTQRWCSSISSLMEQFTICTKRLERVCLCVFFVTRQIVVWSGVNAALRTTVTDSGKFDFFSFLTSLRKIMTTINSHKNVSIGSKPVLSCLLSTFLEIFWLQRFSGFLTPQTVWMSRHTAARRLFARSSTGLLLLRLLPNAGGFKSSEIMQKKSILPPFAPGLALNAGKVRF